MRQQFRLRPERHRRKLRPQVITKIIVTAVTKQPKGKKKKKRVTVTVVPMGTRPSSSRMASKNRRKLPPPPRTESVKMAQVDDGGLSIEYFSEKVKN